MKQLILTTSIADIRPVFTQGASENIKRFSQLKKLFEENKEYLVFAEPIPAGENSIAWHTEFEGQVVPFNKLSQQDQELAKGRLKFQVNKLYKAAVKYNKATSGGENSLTELFDLLDSCIEIPDYKDIYIIQTIHPEKNFVLIRWGFTTDDFNAQMGLVKKLVPIKVTTINVKAIYSTHKPAVKEKLTLEFLGKKIDGKTDDYGNIYLEDIPFLTKISVYQINKNGERINQHDYVCDERDEYIFSIGVPFADMNFKLTDKSGNPIPNEIVYFEYAGNKVQYTTNEAGLVLIKNIPLGTEVKCFQDSTNIQKFTSDFNQNEYLISGIIPTVTMNLKVIDNLQQPIPSIPITITYEGNKLDFTTDSYGKIILPEIILGSEVTCSQYIEGNLVHEQHFVCDKNKQVYLFTGVKLVTSGTVKIKVIDQNGKTIPNAKLKIEYEGISLEKTSDMKGVTTLDDIAFGTTVSCYHIFEGKDLTHHLIKYSKDQNEYIIQCTIPVPIQLPKFCNVQIQIFDNKKETIPNLKITFDYDYITSNRITDQEGRAFLEKVPVNSKLYVKAEHKGIKCNKEIICTRENEVHEIILKKKKIMVVVWLIPLIILLLIGLYLAKPYLLKPATMIVVDTIKKTDTTVKKPILQSAGLTIHLIDKDEKTPIAEATIIVEYNGIKLEKKSTKEGSVNFKEVPENSSITTKIKAVSYSEQLANFQFVREKTFYLSKKETFDYSDVPLNCGSAVSSGGYGTTIRVFDMKKPKGQFRIYYNMFQIPDELIIYNGIPAEMSESKIIYNSGGPVLNMKYTAITFNSPNNLISIKVIGRDQQTTWSVQIWCPE